MDQNVAFASEGRELALTDNIDDEETEVLLDSDGQPLEDNKEDATLDFTGKILEEQFEYH